MFKKNKDHNASKRSAHVKFDNSNPYKPTLNGKRLEVGKLYDVDAVVNQLIRQHNTFRAQRYLNEIRQYITYEDGDTLNSISVKSYLDELFPEFSEEDFQLEIQLLHDINKMGCHVLFSYRIDSIEDDVIKK